MHTHKMSFFDILFIYYTAINCQKYLASYQAKHPTV